MRVLVAVAVRAIILTFSGTRLLASPIARKSFRNVSPLLEETRERFIKLLRESERERGREGERERGRERERERERVTISSRNEPHQQPSLLGFPYKPGSAACPSIARLLKEPLDSYT